MATKMLNIRLPENIYAQLEALAESTERTKSFIATHALLDYLHTQSWQINDIKNGLIEADNSDLASDDDVESFFIKYGC